MYICLGNKCGLVRRMNDIKSSENQIEGLKFGVVGHREPPKTFKQTDLDKCSILDKTHLRTIWWLK